MPFIARAMTESDKDDAFGLLNAFLTTDAHFLDSSAAYGGGGEKELRAALALFIAKPEHGFVWLLYESGVPVACCVACFAISTTAGGVVAKLDDVSVVPGREGRGIGSALMDSLKAELHRRGVKRIDTSCHFDNPRALAFYLRHGFREVREARLAHVL